MGNQKQFEFRIIAGQLKGKKLVAPDLGITRPPLSRLRKAIFDYLTPYLPGAGYLDLFSGTGAYLFEAVSRGARTAVGVELESQLVASINHQAGQYGVADRLGCRCRDVFEAIPEFSLNETSFDIVMIAPPQYQGFLDRTLKLIKKHPLLEADGQIICQHDSTETAKVDWSGFEIRQRRKHGNTTFTILEAFAG